MSYLAGLGSARGIFNYVPLSADTIFLLIVYGGLLSRLQVIDMFGQLGNAIGRLVRGGVAYSAVVASSLIGMVTGQAVSNIALSGSMTIPTMMKRGFSGPKAGAVECLASNGSQLLPPIMGLGAFLMASILGIPYIDVAKAAIFPAVLYVAIILISVRALIQGSDEVGRDKQDIDWRLTLSVLPSFILSLGVIVYILSDHYSGGMAGVLGIAVLLATSILRPKSYRPSLEDIAGGIVDGAVNAAKLALVLAAIGVLVQTMITTGLGFKLGRLMLDISGGNLFVGLVLGMLLSLLIGMGLPTPAAYTVIAIVVIPVLIDLGVTDLAAHFFGFYFGIFSSISPPVAVGVLTAVRISGAGFFDTAWECIRLGSLGFLLPFLFVAYPSTLDVTALTVPALSAAALLMLATFMAGCAFYGELLGRLATWERALLTLGPVAFIMFLFMPSVWIPLFAVALLVGVIARRRYAPSSPGAAARHSKSRC
jgi:TRAP transporter 4TM/12TM fusion protein